MAHTGNSSLHLVVAPGGIGLTTFYQDFPALTTATNYTCSFWYRGESIVANLNFRFDTRFRTTVNPSIVRFSPGAPNPAFGAKAPFPELWLNEAQPENLTGLTDHQGEREPWIALYNPGPTAITLEGYYLAKDYANLAAWPFPAGSSIQSGEFKVIIADNEPNETTTAEWHTSIRPDPGTGSVVLAWTRREFMLCFRVNAHCWPSRDGCTGMTRTMSEASWCPSIKQRTSPRS